MRWALWISLVSEEKHFEGITSFSGGGADLLNLQTAEAPHGDHVSSFHLRVGALRGQMPQFHLTAVDEIGGFGSGQAAAGGYHRVQPGAGDGVAPFGPFRGSQMGQLR